MVAVAGGTRTAFPGVWPLAGSGRRDRTRRLSPPLRLTRRGKMVATSASALVVGVLSVMLATTAQAAHAGSGPSSPGRSVAHVTVLSGQSLWSLAREYDPDADPRAVMAEIIQMNSLGTDQLQAGQVLWLPRG